MPRGIFPNGNKGQFKKGEKNPWTKEHRENHKLAFLKYNGSNHHSWKGDNIGYMGVHDWVRKNIGTPTKCDHCGIPRQKIKNKWNIQLANKNHTYKRNLTDWIFLCVPCHEKYDYKNNLKYRHGSRIKGRAL